MNFANLVQQAQQMQKKVAKAKKEFDEKEFDIASQNDIITGKIIPDSGKIEWCKRITTGYLDQHTVLKPGQTIYQVLCVLNIKKMFKIY